MSIRTQSAFAPPSTGARRAHQPPSLKLKALPLALVTAAGLSLGLVGTAAQAATIVVNDGGDAASASVCILRDAVRFMQNGSISGTTGCTNTGGAFGTADTITFGNAITTVNLTQPSPLLYGVFNATQSLLIQGTGQGGITITRPSPNAGLIYQYGGDLTLDGITLSGGRTTNGGAVQIDLFASDTKLQLKNSVITGNSASSAGAGIYAPSGFNAVATVTITNSTIRNNYAFGGPMDGAGIYLGGASTLTMTGSTLSNNGDAGGTRLGGGIYAAYASTVTLTNSTLSNNVSNCQGAGLYVQNLGAAQAKVTLTSSTFAYNGTQNSQCADGGGLYQYGGSLTLNNSIMANNTNGGSAADIRGSNFQTLTVNGTNNLVQNVSSAVLFTNARLTSDPLLGSLQNNGGPTFTHALIAGSPAIDAGGSTALTTDQRGAGFQRVVGTAVDIGAFEAPINGACGSASSSIPVLAQPTANLCSAGTATVVSGPQPFTWGCNGIGGGSTSTSATACSVPVQQWTVTPYVTSGPASGSISPNTAQTVNQNASTSFTLTPASGYSLGTVTGCNGTLSGATYTTGGATGNCNVIASFNLTPINGACGTASSATPALVAPSANLCSTGTATAVSGTGPWTWGCNGNATGTSTSATACTVAIKTWAVTPSVSGGNGAIAPSTVVTVNNNAATSFTVTPSNGYNIASVVGCGGTLSGAAFNIAAVTADCAVVAMFSAVPRAAISLSGNAIPIPNGDTTPALPDGTDFGSLTIGQTALHSFTITNSGTTALTINGLSFSGANAADFTVTSPTVFPVIVNASASTNFSVRFTPTAIGPRNASLVIAYDDGVASGVAGSTHLKALGATGFAVQGVGLAAVAALPVPALGLGGLVASLLGLLFAGVAGLRRGGKR